MPKPPTTSVPSQNFVAGRCGPGVPVAIVLHEYDGAIENLDAQVGRCVAAYAAGCHTSFHYGVSNCVIHQYVQDADTAWSFFGSGECGVGTWPLANVYPGVDANCYTLNIAVATGVLGLNGICEPNPNNYSAQTLQCLAELVCALAQQYSIAPDLTHIYRHNGDLIDMPFTTFLQTVISCINAPPVTDPGLTDFCARVSTLPDGGVAGATTQLVGADCVLYTVPTAGGGGTNHPPLAVNFNQLTNTFNAATQILNLAAAPASTPETPLTANDSSTLDFTTSGTAQHTVTAAVKVSAFTGNQVAVRADGLYVPPAAAATETALTAVDSTSIDFTTSGAAQHTLTGTVKVAPNGGIVAGASGLAVDMCGLGAAGNVSAAATVPVCDAGVSSRATLAQLAANLPQTPITATDSSTVDFTASGVNQHTLTAAVKISAATNNAVVANGDGLYVPTATAFDLCTALAARPAGAVATPGVTALVGADCQTHTIPAETVLTVTDSSTVDLTASGTAGHALTAVVKLSATAGNQVVANADGLYVPAGVQTPLTATDSATIDFTTSGTDQHTLTGVVKLSATAGNQTVANADGLFTPAFNLCAAVGALPAGAAGVAGTTVVLGADCQTHVLPVETVITPTDTPTINLTVSGAAAHTLQADVLISATAGNQVVANSDGLYVPNSAAAETPLTAVDSGSIDFTTSGTALHTLTADVIYSADAGNIAVAGTDGGVYVPDLTTQLPVPDCSTNVSDTLFLSQTGWSKSKDTLGVRSVATGTTVSATADSVVVATASVTVTLPAAPAGCDRRDFWIVNADPANTLTIDGGGANIGGAATIVLTGAGAFSPLQGEAAHVVWDGTQWFII